VKTFLKSVNIWHIMGKNVDCVVHFLQFLGVWLQLARDSHLLAGNFAKYSSIEKISLANKAINLS